VTYDVPQSVVDAVRHIAEQEGLTASAVAAAFLAHAVEQYRAGEIVLDPVKQDSSSYRWDYTIDDETILAVLRGEVSLSTAASEPAGDHEEAPGAGETSDATLSPLDRVMAKE
jgi:imidazole glycerol phosphate synthase subunit HisF